MKWLKSSLDKKLILDKCMKKYLNSKRSIKAYQSKLMNDSLEKELETNYKKKESLRAINYNNALVCPLKKSSRNNSPTLLGGVYDSEGSFIYDSLTRRVSPPNIKMFFDDWFGSSLEEDYSNINKLDKKVIFLGALPKHYGHFITEGISRLWYISQTNDQDAEFVYISEDGPDRFLEIFEIFGIDLSRTHKIEEPTEFSEVVIPEASIRLHDYYHDDYEVTISTILNSVPSSNVDKIYLSKKQRFNGRALGERSIERIFKRNGFKILYPESIPLINFFSILKSAKVLASSSGSSAHNAIFLDKSAQFICLNRSRHHHPLQIMIDEMRELNVVYIEACMNIFRNDFSGGPYNLFPTRYLSSFFADSNFKSFSIFDLAHSFFSTIFYIFYTIFLGKFVNYLLKIKNSILK